MIHVGQLAFRAPNRGVESIFCCWIAGQGLTQKDHIFHRRRYSYRYPSPLKQNNKPRPVHPVSVTRFPSFRTQTLENLSRYLWTKKILSNPDPGENLVSGNLVVETGCTHQLYSQVLQTLCVSQLVRMQSCALSGKRAAPKLLFRYRYLLYLCGHVLTFPSDNLFIIGCDLRRESWEKPTQMVKHSWYDAVWWNVIRERSCDSWYGYVGQCCVVLRPVFVSETWSLSVARGMPFEKFYDYGQFS